MEVWNQGQTGEQSFRILRLSLDAPGEMVTREELRQALIRKIGLPGA